MGAHTTRHRKVGNASPDEKVQSAVALLDVMFITDNWTSKATDVACNKEGKESHWKLYTTYAQCHTLHTLQTHTQTWMIILHSAIHIYINVQA